MKEHFKKFILVCLCLTMFQLPTVFAAGQMITLNIAKGTMSEVFKEIEKQSDYKFFYNNEQINLSIPVDVNVEENSIDNVLKQVFSGTNITYKIINNHIVLTNTTHKNIPSVAQQGKTVRGKIVDFQDEPLIGVNVVVKGTTNGTMTDVDGNFQIDNIPDNAILVFSYIGYLAQEVALNGQSFVNITLREDTQKLDEVVVVGYGTQKKVNLTGSVQNVTSEDLMKRNLSNTSTALQGLIPGVSVQQSSGRPGGDGSSITIRGTGSINSSTGPLVLIDGVEGDINNIDMNAIESVSILKDAASASIYGSRASNGVILVTTKRAQGGGVKISYNAYAGFNTPTAMPDPVNAVEYMEAVNTARKNADMDPQYSDDIINIYKTQGADNLNYYDTNWRDLVIKNAALVHNHSVSLSGGSDVFRMFANAGYYYQDGQISNNDYKRMTLRVNTDAQVLKWMKVGVDINIRQSDVKRPSMEEPESTINKALTFTPVFSGKNDDGTWGFGQNGDNPIAVSKAGGVHTGITPELGIKGLVLLTPFEGFETLASYSSRKVEYKSDYFIKPYDTYENGSFKTTYPPDGAYKNDSWSQTITNQFNLQMSYEKSVAKNYFKVLGGVQTEERTIRSFGASRRGYEFDGFEEINHGDVSTATNSGGRLEWAMVSYFGRINYSFAERYLLELNGRWDASSRFMKDYRWGFFPSISAGWRISEETFFAPLKSLVDNLKLRASYGTLGNQDIVLNGSAVYYPYAASIGSGYGYWFDKTLGSGVAQTQVANEKISWEKSTQLNFGVDGSALNSRINVSFDYYVRKINKMLQQFPVPMFVGLSSPWENAGSMKNNGWDLSVTWRDKVGNVNYHVTGNLSDVKNEVTNLYGNEYIGTQIIKEGLPLRSWYGYVSDGYFQSQEEIDSYPVYGGNKDNVKPGYIRYKDISGPDGIPDGKITDDDRQVIGNPYPRYEFSLNFGADWKGFDFAVFLQGVGKKDILYTGNGARPFYVGRTIFKNQLDTWTPDNRDAEFPLLLIDGSGNNPNNIVSDFWIKSGAYMRLKNLVIGYTIPKNLINKLGINNLRFYVSGQNLFTFSSAYKGYDPENYVSNGNFYPVMQTFSLGVDIRF
ncbi:TonB-dependent receptor [Massilibacteroides sp.]|uniref:TonB-dependent receptor n=1 Tax=Massilibacteroides sp. TaxID=2034766 RepID=UPI00261D1772|nr:TonB-dependent receptor [Massilibacteroides sp.]MDD4515821.1 TonB-dependent receptor [Massilibacteroides sp.]